ncbi:TetR family transcriptional regulator [Marmoricola endophyticus]|uniref:TetR family transcriptional regulator n=1 Tax=Marmoricola endophyticus TaxID=2040280 RepID=A0A917BRJ7_9ACTN|nr:TetR/AcrR family transcriptional regulator [Marmoricola endophyticus]GGF56062.1 TetR family transcriptional regulator [Marmoricola endophyticus]
MTAVAPGSRLEPEARRRQILDAARALYAERPYEDVSAVELAAAAGVARGLLNHYFGSKRALFLTVMRESVTMPREMLEDLGGRPLPERAAAAVSAILDAATTYGQDWVNASGTATLRGDADVQQVVDEADDRAARLVLDALGQSDDPALRVRLRTFAPMVKATCREWLHRGTVQREEAQRTLTDVLLLLVTRP